MGWEIQWMKSGVLSRQAMRVLWTNMLNFQPHYTTISINDYVHYSLTIHPQKRLNMHPAGTLN